MLRSLVFSLKKIYWFIVRPRTRGVKCVVVHGESVLMMRRTFGTDAWVLPGGKIAAGEYEADAARREIREDLGIDIGTPLPIGSFTSTIHNREETLYCFSAHVATPQTQTLAPHIKETRWFPLSELPPLTPVSIRVFELFRISNTH